MKAFLVHWRSELVYAGAVLMEVTWVTLAVTFGNAVTGARASPPSGLGLAILFLAIMALARRIHDLPLDERRRQSLVIYGFLATLLIALKLHFYGHVAWFDPAWIAQSLIDLFEQPGVAGSRLLLILVTAYAWWRGLELAAERPTSVDVFKHFQVEGILLLIFLILASQLVSAEAVVPYAFWFFFFSLITLATARQISLAPERQGGDATWLPMIAGITGLVLLLALIATAFFSLNIILAILQPILEAVGLIVNFIFTLLVYLIVAPLLLLLESLLLRPGQIEIPLLKTLSTLLDEITRLSAEEPPTPPPFLGFLFKALFLIGLGVCIYTLLSWLSHRSRRHQVETGDETRESLWSTVNFWQNLRHFLARLLARLHRRRPAPAIPSPAAAHTVAGRLALTIRQIYALLLRLTAQLGLRRATDQTPYEYLHQLRARWPRQAVDLGHITTAYVQVRYGQIPPTDGEVKTVQAGWERLRHELPATTTVAQPSKSTTTRPKPTNRP